MNSTTRGSNSGRRRAKKLEKKIAEKIAKKIAEKIAKKIAKKITNNLETLAHLKLFKRVVDLYDSRIRVLLEKMTRRLSGPLDIKEICTSAFFFNEAQEITIGFIVEMTGGVFREVLMGDTFPYQETESLGPRYTYLQDVHSGYLDGREGCSNDEGVELDFIISTSTKTAYWPTTTLTSLRVQENPCGIDGVFRCVFPDAYRKLVGGDQGGEEEADDSD
jgi:hypothetical protein